MRVPGVAIIADGSKWNIGCQRVTVPRVLKGLVGYTTSKLVREIGLLCERVQAGRLVFVGL